MKAVVQRWPSAYASGMVVQKYKRAMAARGREPYLTPPAAGSNKKKVKGETGQTVKSGLIRWFDEKWVDIRTGKPCGAARSLDSSMSPYPTCRPTVKISAGTPVVLAALSPAQRRQMIAQKQKAREKTVRYEATITVNETARSPRSAQRGGGRAP